MNRNDYLSIILYFIAYSLILILTKDGLGEVILSIVFGTGFIIVLEEIIEKREVKHE